MLTMTFLGAGSAFSTDVNNYHSNMLLECNGDTLMLDCGSDARHSLNAIGKSYQDIKNVYISHTHADHAGGLEWLGLTTKFYPGASKINLYGNDRVLGDLWSKTLSGGMKTLQNTFAKLETYFNVYPVFDNGSFIWQKMQFQTIQTLHVINGYSFMPTYGLLFKVNGKQIFITTDTQYTPGQFQTFYVTSDIIFHDCETAETRSTVHSHYIDLCNLDSAVKKKMWLYHYNNEFDKLPDAKKDGFCGFVKKGQVFKF